ncbi:hypothetical protein ACP275_11G054300 [Erythranthe tilingii]
MVVTSDINREPCPDRILDDCGSAFAMGAVGGSAFHFIKGMHSSPRGERLFGGAQAVRMSAPRVGGSFAVWGGLFSTFDCSMVYLRQKEDPYNSIIAAAATGGLLSMRHGLRASGKSALIGGVFLALIEGANIMINKALDSPQEGQILVEDLPGVRPPQEAAAAAPSSSWFGGLFGGGKEEEKKSGGGVKTEILESFDSPIPPTFEFK